MKLLCWLGLHDWLPAEVSDNPFLATTQTCARCGWYRTVGPPSPRPTPKARPHEQPMGLDGWVTFDGISYVAQIAVSQSAQPIRSTGELVDVSGIKPDFDGLYEVGQIIRQTVRATLQKLSISEAMKIAEAGPIEATVQLGPSVTLARPDGDKWLFHMDDLSCDETGATVVLTSQCQWYKSRATCAP